MGRHSKSESDIENDPDVADSRTGRRGDGSYVGRTVSEDDFDAGWTGAEARSRET